MKCYRVFVRACVPPLVGVAVARCAYGRYAAAFMGEGYWCRVWYAAGMTKVGVEGRVNADGMRMLGCIREAIKLLLRHSCTTVRKNAARSVWALVRLAAARPRTR